MLTSWGGKDQKLGDHQNQYAKNTHTFHIISKYWKKFNDGEGNKSLSHSVTLHCL